MPRWVLTSVLLGAALLQAAVSVGQEIELTTRSESRLEGRLLSRSLAFSSALEVSGLAIVEIRLDDGRNIRAEIDYVAHSVILRSSADTADEPAPLWADDIAALEELLEAFAPMVSSQNEEALVRTLSFLASYPPGAAVDVDSRTAEKGQKAITSLCSQTGKNRAGTYDVGNRTFSETVKVGPCYSASNECMGRCGPGCKAPPSATIQVFAQDCLNHDLCTRRTGNILGECADEWGAASDDFLIGPDCGSLTSTWKDNYSLTWKLTQGVSVSGTVQTSVQCQGYTVSGTHSGANISLTASRLFPGEGCCRAFTYTGKANGCNAASGTWRSVCGRTGTWTLTRQGRRRVFELSEEDDAAWLDPTGVE